MRVGVIGDALGGGAGTLTLVLIEWLALGGGGGALPLLGGAGGGTPPLAGGDGAFCSACCA